MSLDRDRLLLELRRARGPLLALLVLAVFAAIAGWGIFRNQVFQKPWVDYYDVRAAVGDAKGIVPGKQDVRIAGIKVGVITKSELVDGRPVITLSLEPRYAPLYRDATIRVRPVTPLQDMYVDVTRGTPSAGRLTAKTILAATPDTTPVDVSRVLQTFNADTRDRLGTLLREMGPALDDNGAQLQAAFVTVAPFLQSAQGVAEALASRRVALRRAVTNFGTLTAALGSRDTQLARLVRNGEGTLDELADHDRDLDGVLRALPPTLQALQGSMRTLAVAQQDLDPALEELRPAAADLQPALASLRDLGGDLEPAAAALRPALQALRPMAQTLRPTSASLARAFGTLRGQAPSFDTLTREIVPCGDVIRDFFGNTPSVAKFGNAAGAYPRGDVSVGFDTVLGLKNDNLTRVQSCTDGSGKTGGRK